MCALFQNCIRVSERTNGATVDSLTVYHIFIQFHLTLVDLHAIEELDIDMKVLPHSKVHILFSSHLPYTKPYFCTFIL